MLRCSERAENTGGVDPYSTGDYCETPDSASMRHGEGLHCANTKHLYHAPSISRCLKKHYRCSPQRFYHQPRPSLSIPNRRYSRSGGKKLRRSHHHVDETTSMDERKSMTSYSSLLTVDVTREMEAVNRDIEEIIRKCDDLHGDNVTNVCRGCCHHRKSTKMDQKRILKKPPLDKLKEIPLALLKPRPPRYSLKEKSYSAPQTKYKTSRDIRDIVEETDALLRNVYKELSRSKCHRGAVEDDICQCEGTRGVSDPRPATCLERFLGCQNKCRRILENRWMRPKWRDVLEKGDMIRMLHPVDERIKHYHDTNCVSEPTSSCLMKVRKDYQDPYRTVMKLKDMAVNTDNHESNNNKQKVELNEKKSNTMINTNNFENINGRDTDKMYAKNEEKKYDIDLQPLKVFASCNTESNAKNYMMNCDKRFLNKRSQVEDGHQRMCKRDEWNESKSLLLDRNMGLSLDRGEPKVKLLQEKETSYDGNFCPERPVIPLPENFMPAYEEDVGSKKSGAGDTLSALETSKSFISQIINKIVNKRVDMPPINLKVMYEQLNQEKHDFDCGPIDSSICLEIMRRLIDLLNRNDQHRFENIGELPVQYTRVRRMKQEHLMNIEKELKYIQDLEFYLVNASPSRS